MRHPIAKKDVDAAVSQLRKAGTKITVRSVRDHLGRGSYSTITQFLNDDGVAVGSALSQKDAAFDALREQLYEICYDEAYDNVQKELAEKRRSVDLDRAEFEATKRHKVTEAEKVARKAEEHLKEVEEKRSAETKAYQDELMAIKLENAELRGSLKAALQAKEDLTKQRDDLNAANDQLTRTLTRVQPKQTRARKN